MTAEINRFSVFDGTLATTREIDIVCRKTVLDPAGRQ